MADERLTLWQKLAVRSMRKKAGRKRGEELSPEDWAIAYQMGDGIMPRALHRVWRLGGQWSDPVRRSSTAARRASSEP